MDLQVSLSRYEILDEIGKGSYGVVYKAKDLTENSLVALKKMPMKESKEGLSHAILREVGILSRLEHPNIVAIKEFFMQSGSCYIAFEYLDRDLTGFLSTLRAPLQEIMLKFYMHQLLTGLSYCHSNCVVHRDLKPQNLLIANEQLRIADFGLSKLSSYPEEPITPAVQTLWYRAPELLVGTVYNEKIDLWSVGCVFAEMIACRPIFTGLNPIDQLTVIFKIMEGSNSASAQHPGDFKTFEGYPSWSPNRFKELFQVLSEDGADLMSRLLVMDPNKRLNAYQALNHSYFREFNYVRPQSMKMSSF